ncbi:MAG: hypothetical protein AMJ61_10070 [Desulfobacterales bacterium SG8_35_2]|nr:MAG: hypothetical protein AMJ61_10070 [Desulfobacterales bacterium SG8_35_2]
MAIFQGADSCRMCKLKLQRHQAFEGYRKKGLPRNRAILSGMLELSTVTRCPGGALWGKKPAKGIMLKKANNNNRLRCCPAFGQGPASSVRE